MVILAFAETIQLLPDGSLLIHVVMILAMIWILNRTFFRPINSVIASREKNKGGQNTEAQGILKEASGKRAEYAKQMQQVRSEGYSLIEKERSRAMAEKQAKIESAKIDIAQMVETQNTDLKNQIAAAEAEISEEAEKMAEEISSNILKSA